MSGYLEGVEDFQPADGWPQFVSKSKKPVALTSNPRGNRTCHTCGCKITKEYSFTCSKCLGKLVDKVKLNKPLFDE